MTKLLPGTPRYRQLKDFIVGNIDTGSWPPDSKILSENDLCGMFGVSRMTANRALRELSESGILYRVQGLGTFVAERKPESSMFEIRNIADEIRSRGHRHSSRVVLRNEITADPHVCHYLELSALTKVYHSIIIHYENDLPLQYEERFVNRKLAPGYHTADFTTITPNVYLSEVAPLGEAENIIESILADKIVAEALKIKAGNPCLLVSRRTWSGGVPVCYARLIHPGSRYRILGRIKTYAEGVRDEQGRV